MSNLPRELRYAQLRNTVYHTENSIHLDQNIGIIWHKRNMLVNDDTAECGICFSEKKETFVKLPAMAL